MATLLWPDADTAAARDRLSQALVWLRRHLEPDGIARGSVLITDRLSIGLSPDAVTTDVADFEIALKRAEQDTAPPAQRDPLDQAIRLYRGDLLPDEYADWALVERRRLLDAYLHALQRRAGLYERDGELGRAIALARRAVEAAPLREEGHQELIRLLGAAGHGAAAALQFRELKRLLGADIGVEPSPATQALLHQIQQEQTTSREALPVADAPTPRRPTLPPMLTRFFGREAERERIARLIQGEAARLVTLIGAGGSGKTRLGLAVASDLGDAYKGAVAFVPLADLSDARMIPAAIAAALRVNAPASRPPLEPVVEMLASESFLLVLDNLEHLADEAPPLLRDLLERAPGLTLVVTSRRRLGLEGEREVSVSSLPVPQTDVTLEQALSSPAVQLFQDRARAVRPDFTVTTSNAAAVVRICERLDGIPLAIELCAAWAQMLTPDQMLEKLARRFDLLVSRRTDITPRHRTLRAALEYSYLQLTEPLRQLFRRLSVFRGGWSLESAKAVCYDPPADPLDVLTELTELRERSLIVAEEVVSSDGGRAMRYRLLETLREYAGELLTYAESADLRGAHAAYFLGIAEPEGVATTSSPEREKRLSAVGQEIDNLRAALAWSAETHATASGLQLALALSRYWSAHGPLQEGQYWLQQFLELSAMTPPDKTPSALLRARGWTTLGYLVWSQGDYAVARAAHGQALSIRREAGDRTGVAESLYHLGITAYRQSDYVAARAFLEESLSLAREQSDQAGVARVLLNLGNIALDEGDHETARPFFQQSLALEEALGNRQRVANALNNLGLVALALQDREEAVHLFEASVALYRELNDDGGAVTPLANLATCARLLGENERARTLLNEGIRLSYDLGDRFALVHHLLQLGILEADEGTPTRGVFLLSAARNLFERVVGTERITGADGYQEALTDARKTLGDKEFDSLWVRGRTAPLDQVIAEALSSAGDTAGNTLET